MDIDRRRGECVNTIKQEGEDTSGGRDVILCSEIKYRNHRGSSYRYENTVKRNYAMGVFTAEFM